VNPKSSPLLLTHPRSERSRSTTAPFHPNQALPLGVDRVHGENTGSIPVGRAKHINGLVREVRDRHDRWPSCEGRRRALSYCGSTCRPACAFRPAKLGAWIPLRPSAFSPSRQCLCAMRWRDVVIGSCCCSPFRALSGLSTASFRELGHLAWSRQSGQWSPCGAGSRRHISDFCIDPRLLAERPPLLDEPRSRSRPAHHAFKRLSQRTNETPERATSGASLSCARPRGRLRSNPALGNRCLLLQRADVLGRTPDPQNRS
jgi:hypothetical protein